MSTIVVAGSTVENNFLVIDFTIPAMPVNTLVYTPFTGGCTVDCSGNYAAVGCYASGQVAIYDISNPASPTQVALVTTPLNGIGAISIDGKHVLAGELQGERLVWIDISNPSNPTALTPFTSSVQSVTSLSLKGTLAVASSNSATQGTGGTPNNFFFYVFDYTNPAAPVQTQFTPGTGGVYFGNVVCCDLYGTYAAVGCLGTGTIYLFNVAGGNISLLGQYVADLIGVSSISISGSIVAAAYSTGFQVTVVDFTNQANPTGGDTTPPNIGIGPVVKVAPGFLAVGGGTNSFVVDLLGLAGSTANLLDSDTNLAAGDFGSIGLTISTAAQPEPSLTFTPSSLAFGAIRVNTTSSSQTITLKNTGTAPLSITGLKTSISQFSAVGPFGSGPFSIPANRSQTVKVTFTPSAAMSYSAQLTFSSNDPANATVSISLSGSGGYPQLAQPQPLNFGNVAVCMTHSLNEQITNNGPVDLHLSSITTTGTGFSASPSSLTVPANGTGNITVTLTPATTGPVTGTLQFLSDDPNTPNPSVALSGTGTPEPPPSISVSPTSLNFGSVALQYYSGLALTVANTGPCESLKIQMTVTGPFTLAPANATTLQPGQTSLNDSILSSTSNNYIVVFTPTTQGSATGILTIASNDPANPSVNISLTGTGVPASPAAIELILDRSGSMATPVTGGTRMTALQSAVNMFAQLLIPGTGFSMGSVQFDSTEAVLTALANFDATQQTAIISGANSLSPRYLTSIGGGLQLAQTSLASSATSRNVAIVFTDGYENTPPMIATVEPGVVSAGTEVYCVGLGDPVYLSVAALQSLASSSNGKFFQTTDSLVLRKQFVEVLADAFRQNMAADPIINLQQGVPMTVPVQITNCDSRITFIVLWEDPTAQIQFTVRAPDGTTYGANAGANNLLARYIPSPGYRFFQIALPPGPNGTIGPKQLGQWKMLINPIYINGGSTRASTNVVVDSELQITAAVQATKIGAPMNLAVNLNHAGVPVTNAHVAVSVTSPLTSLSQLSTPIVQRRATTADTQHIPPSLQILTKTKTTRHEARFDKRQYVLELPAPTVDGVYNFEVTATGNACGGTFDRYWSASYYVGLPARLVIGSTNPGTGGQAVSTTI